MNPLLLIVFFLQLSSILKNLTKEASVAERAVVTKGVANAAKASLKVSKVSQRLLLDEFMLSAIPTKLGISEEKAIAGYSKSAAVEEKAIVNSKKSGNLNKAEQNLVQKKTGLYEKMDEKEYEKIIEEKIEDAIEDFISEQYGRTHLAWKASMFELMKEKNWGRVKIYFKKVYHFDLEHKVDFLLLMNEMPVNSFQLSSGEINRFLSRKSKVMQTVTLENFYSEMANQKPILDKLSYYAETKNLNVSFLKRRSRL